MRSSGKANPYQLSRRARSSRKEIKLGIVAPERRETGVNAELACEARADSDCWQVAYSLNDSRANFDHGKVARLVDVAAGVGPDFGLFDRIADVTADSDQAVRLHGGDDVAMRGHARCDVVVSGPTPRPALAN